tara:strand:+ start:1614 stop:1808 length:195 start_codon:yes stop_codon:yes gene_type:complete
MNKITIKARSSESRDQLFNLLTEDCSVKCGDCPGGYIVSGTGLDFNYIGVFCENITIYYDEGDK